MVDIAVVGLSMGLKLEDFENLDLAYAPPFSTAIHPFVQAVYVLENKLSGAMQSMTPAQYAAGAAEGYTVIDVNPQPTIRGAKFVDLSKVEGPIEGIGKEEKLLLVCGRGKRAYFLQNRLKLRTPPTASTAGSSPATAKSPPTRCGPSPRRRSGSATARWP